MYVFFLCLIGLLYLDRVVALQNMIDVAEECRRLKNYQVKIEKKIGKNANFELIFCFVFFLR